MAEPLARQVVATGTSAERVAAELVERLRAPDLRLAIVVADWRLEPAVIARVTQRGLAPAPVVGGTTIGVIAPSAGGGGGDARGGPGPELAAAGLGLYGDWLRVGIGLATDLPRSALTRSRDAVEEAAAALGTSASLLDPARHVGITILDGSCGHEEAFCIGSAAAAPQIRVVGGCAAIEVPSPRRAHVWCRGEALPDAGAVVVLATELPVYAITSTHLRPTDVKTVVTGASGRVITELDGRPAARRLYDLVRRLGDEPERPEQPLATRYAFARYISRVPYVRSMVYLDGDRIVLAGGVETGHVLRLMRTGDLIGTTRRDLALAADRVGGAMAALLAMSCIGRHWEAAERGIAHELAEVYAAYPTIGYQSSGEQSGMLLVNHSLTALAIGARR
ncbi:MAG TPA: FIST N-terminal domain-containing protein [Kofleriaceae bacterium]|nr:FIST N-terminal domain-containing protein [Kofleriaceae bacterium]